MREKKMKKNKSAFENFATNESIYIVKCTCLGMSSQDRR